MKNKIVYLDYSATTKIDKSVLEYFNLISEEFYANPNSNHKLGSKSQEIIDDTIDNITSFFNIKKSELIFTSGATESNNMALKGVYNNDKKHIITTMLEHSSIYGPLGYLQKEGYKIEFVSLKKDGTVDLNKLKNMITDETLLVSIVAVDSELGIRQPIEEIGKLLKNYDGIYFHSDITQCLGKDQIDISNVDLASFSGHKLYCFKGIGGLIKKEHVKMIPLIHGGKSISEYRSGTPQTELIGALNETFNQLKKDILEKKKHIKNLNDIIRSHIKKYNAIKINSTNKSIPHILNISFLNKNSNSIQEYFEKHNIFVSTKTACASKSDLSKSVLILTNDEDRAFSSIRISLSYKTTKKEVVYFLKILDKLMGEYDEID